MNALPKNFLPIWVGCTRTLPGRKKYEVTGGKWVYGRFSACGIKGDRCKAFLNTIFLSSYEKLGNRGAIWIRPLNIRIDTLVEC